MELTPSLGPWRARPNRQWSLLKKFCAHPNNAHSPSQYHCFLIFSAPSKATVRPGLTFRSTTFSA